MSIIQTRITDEEDQLIKEYSRTKNMSVSSLIREAVFEKIEDEIDLQMYEEAMREHAKNPKAIPFDEMVKLING